MTEMAGIEWVQEPLFPLPCTTHAVNDTGGRVTLCCNEFTWNLPLADKASSDPARVTCPSLKNDHCILCGSLDRT